MKIYKTIFFLALFALILAGCSALKSGAVDENSPTGVLRKFVEASQKKDVETMKQTLSAGTLKVIEDSAKKQNMTLEEALKKDDGKDLKEMPETRNEQIEGDTATVEVKNTATGDWDKIPFVKEDGKWKVALDKYMDELIRKMSERMPQPAPTTGGGIGAGSGNTNNTPAANKKQ